MASCQTCGKEVQVDATFCPSCGSNLEQASRGPVQTPSSSY
ncbi:MAG: zinc-ribbon domain-containing protein, partial [Nitrososphaerales archaeon]